MFIFCDDLVSSRLGGFGIFLVLCSNPGEAVVELYGHLRSRTFRYEVSLGLFHPLIMDEVAPVMWENLYTSVELLKPIRIATSLEWANTRMGYYD